MAWKVSSWRTGDTGSKARSRMMSWERALSGPWWKRGNRGAAASVSRSTVREGGGCPDSDSCSHLPHGGVVGLVGVQFVLDQLGQGGVVLVLTDAPGDRQVDRWVERQEEFVGKITATCKARKYQI